MSVGRALRIWKRKKKGGLEDRHRRPRLGGWKQGLVKSGRIKKRLEEEVINQSNPEPWRERGSGNCRYSTMTGKG